MMPGATARERRHRASSPRSSALIPLSSTMQMWLPLRRCSSAKTRFWLRTLMGSVTKVGSSPTTRSVTAAFRVPWTGSPPSSRIALWRSGRLSHSPPTYVFPVQRTCWFSSEDTYPSQAGLPWAMTPGSQMGAARLRLAHDVVGRNEAIVSSWPKVLSRHLGAVLIARTVRCGSGRASRDRPGPGLGTPN